ncbi:L-histidine N(alpha)-methyltransferase [Geomonas sp.]|uniref:L-histidine N(alpha)-methyltransferase n=1 Tax=Geomonas sp. TaxID=2651584 RepID=UPI002B460722|nr:L-histidine N(alpha)-methyltransferase [Geomonas sp.]HJV34543.1 L-histidine N(alpha)-methyltransferase [Geomonas sp.]
MDPFFASPDLQICRRFRDACTGTGSTIVRRPPGDDPAYQFACSAASGLLSAPRHLESRFLYDAEGSALFERITQQPEYYLTRTETSILAAHASRIRELTGPVTLVELGSGSSLKTDLLLHAWLEQASRGCYVPVDVSDSALAGACGRINAKFPQVRVIGVNSEYQDAFPLLPLLSPSLVLFLGSSIGNFSEIEMTRFLTALAASLQPTDFFLLGIDLVKEKKLLEAAYNDAAGVTANFTRNMFARMNRELGSSVDTGAIEHVARYEEGREQIETFAYFTSQQAVFLAPLDRQFLIPQGEMVQVEISRKFHVESLLPYLKRFGFLPEQVFTDERGWYALVLLRRAPKYYGCRGRL